LSGVTGSPAERISQLLQYADRVGIERLIVFMGHPFVSDPTPEEVRRQNDQVLRAVEHSGGRALGFVYLNPKHTEESPQELDRCVRHGPMAGIKLWMAVRELGPERVVYASDYGGRSFASQLAKVYGAQIPDHAKQLILAGNVRRILRPILRAKGLA
jgi:predicted TIM-barrel fold metal-dependent hydrolase